MSSPDEAPPPAPENEAEGSPRQHTSEEAPPSKRKRVPRDSAADEAAPEPANDVDASMDKLVSWNAADVPESFVEALTTKYRGQRWGAHHQFMMDHFFNEEAIYEAPPHGRLPTIKDNVKTRLVCRFDDSLKAELAYGAINPGKFVKRIFESSEVPEAEKQILSKKVKTAHSRKWSEGRQSEDGSSALVAFPSSPPQDVKPNTNAECAATLRELKRHFEDGLIPNQIYELRVRTVLERHGM
ncbi:hypothetical protein M885DRAFT_547440 [Pelagophyceae sp. CCMP2097]|nr:hypothetical protein M885DRAFT_547440 [Pelagophyceae sp. CCMP2097]|mmetsp:Transcript_1219/g.4299  ORF Transcript_1219/g.4299 Transcript_1219/m.4299 type:complete len:241 (-) Transcript_1219:196-918(-)